MSYIKIVLLEQVKHIQLMFRMALFDVKGTYQIHYLGTFWQFLNPAIQVAIYWIVFGIGIRGGQPIGDIPYLAWLLVGLIPWFFISPTIIQGSNSVHQKVTLVSKMNFPVSVLPTIKIISNSFSLGIFLIILFLMLLINGVMPTIYLIQLPYYLIAMYFFIFGFTLLSSTIATLIRDYQMLLQSMMRMLLYLSPILWDPSASSVPDILKNILKINPFYYIIEGFRNSFIGGKWFFEQPIYTLYFWLLTLVFIYFGSKIHIKFRKDFVDYL